MRSVPVHLGQTQKTIPPAQRLDKVMKGSKEHIYQIFQDAGSVGSQGVTAARYREKKVVAGERVEHPMCVSVMAVCKQAFHWMTAAHIILNSML